MYCGAEPGKKSSIKSTEKFLFKKTIDIVFCIDCSWPMAPVLDSIKDNIVRLIEEIDQYNQDSSHILADWRARVLGYRNFEEDYECLLNDNPFVSSIEELNAQLLGLVCKGCSENNQCSSSLDALWYATKCSDWRPVEHSESGEYL